MVGKRTNKSVCEFCDIEFTPSYRNGSRQRFCCKTPECRAASKAASQKAWLSKPENQEYFRGPEQVKRVLDWRRKKKAAAMPAPEPQKEVLQDDCSDNHPQKQADSPPPPPRVLQDDWMQHPVIVGMIAWLTGSALQDDIAGTVRRMHTLGSDILNNPQGGKHAFETPGKSPPVAQGSQPVQLGGSQAGP
ncbi:hypothetical protein [Desulfonatronum sp. SC1]|uniref:hypothetical protein n=1 Tax=Desulfonatronum sp. SC1 TaxID=2109626 RepID=UPI0011B1F95F|nr:hypothetical protein [Desulfonatronum sp. SC1]